MAILQKLDILSIGRLKTEAVEVEGGDTIIISELGAADSYSLFTDPAFQDENGGLKMTAFAPALLARCIVNEDGARIFSDEEIGTIARMPSGLFSTLSAAAMRINGLTGEAEAAKN